MYALQAALMNMGVSLTPDAPYKLPPANGSVGYYALVPTPVPLSASIRSTFSELPRPRGHSPLIGSLSLTGPTQQRAVSPRLPRRARVRRLPLCPGWDRGAQLLAVQQGGRGFISEEFCVVLNHNRVLAHDPSARIRTLFTDLLQSDAQDPIYLVCKIVRNGSLKMGSNMGMISENARQTVIGPSYNVSMSSESFGCSSSSTDPPQCFRRPFECTVLEPT